MGKGNMKVMLEVDLSKKEIKKTILDEGLMQDYMGGLGIGVKTLYDTVGPGIEALSENNIIVLAPGPLSGTNAPTGGRTHVVTKSPVTEILGMGNFGGLWGVNLKKAGYEAVSVSGKSESPLILWINDENVKLIEAGHLWGKDTYETIDSLKDDLGDDISVLAIGQAGENLVKFACPVVDYDNAAGRSHAGCIMGHKKLKAIAVRGTKEVLVAEKEKFKEAVDEATKRINDYPGYSKKSKEGCYSSEYLRSFRFARTGNFVTGEMPEGHDLLKIPESFTDNTANKPNSYCHNCILGPHFGCHIISDVDSGPYKGVKTGGVSYPLVGTTFGITYGIKTFPAMFKANELCQRYGIDVVNPVTFAIELYENEIIDKTDTNGLELKIGNEKEIMEMFRKIAYREGLGNILAEGITEAARLIGKGAEKYALAIKNHQMFSIKHHFAGAAVNLGCITCLRGGDDLTSTHSIHNVESYPGWAVDLGWDSEEYMAWLVGYLDMFPEEKDSIFGNPPDVEFFNKDSFNGKARLTIWFENMTSIINSLGTCMFATLTCPAMGPSHLAKLYSACTGHDITSRELVKIGEKIYNLMKMYNARAGLARKDDHYPARVYEDPISGGPFKGTVLSKGKIEKALDEYYELRGWDVKTGIPTKEKLAELGLDHSIF